MHLDHKVARYAIAEEEIARRAHGSNACEALPSGPAFDSAGNRQVKTHHGQMAPRTPCRRMLRPRPTRAREVHQSTAEARPRSRCRRLHLIGTSSAAAD